MRFRSDSALRFCILHDDHLRTNKFKNQAILETYELSIEKLQIMCKINRLMPQCGNLKSWRMKTDG